MHLRGSQWVNDEEDDADMRREAAKRTHCGDRRCDGSCMECAELNKTEEKAE